MTEVVVWQLGESREACAIEDLRRIEELRLDDLAHHPMLAGRSVLDAIATETLDKIDGTANSR